MRQESSRRGKLAVNGSHGFTLRNFPAKAVAFFCTSLLFNKIRALFAANALDFAACTTLAH